MRWSTIGRAPETHGRQRLGDRVLTGSGSVAMVLLSASLLGACNLVLGIDDVSSANGPDGGQRISATTAEPRDASTDSSNPSPSGRADSGSRASEAGPDASSRGRLDASAASDRDATAPIDNPGAAADLDAGDEGDDAGVPR
jgi:hypothetical protein